MRAGRSLRPGPEDRRRGQRRAGIDEDDMNEDQAYSVMITAHRRGACVVAVFTKDIAETKATRATEAGRSKGYPLLFTTEPEE